MGVTFCIAAGNSYHYQGQTLGSPATSPSAISVAAVDKSDSLAYFSSAGPAPFSLILKPEISAPGMDINSTVLGNIYAKYSNIEEYLTYACQIDNADVLKLRNMLIE